MQVKFYGRLGEKLGPEIEIELPDGRHTIHTLRALLASRFPEASDDLRERSKACVEDSIVGEDYRLDSTQTVEFFPPLSGG